MEISSTSPSLDHRPPVSVHELPAPSTIPVLQFHAEELNEGVSSILTNLFSYTSRSARVQGTATGVRKALDNGDLALLSVKRQPRCHQCFPLVLEPSRWLGTRHLPAAGTDSPGNDAGDRLPVCAVAMLWEGLVLPVHAEPWERAELVQCHGHSRCRLLGCGEPAGLPGAGGENNSKEIFRRQLLAGACCGKNRSR